MSRSKPSNNEPHPCERWFEWRGSEGILRWYDKEAKENVPVKLPFKCVLLDRTATVRGYNQQHGQLYANEVRDTRSDPFIVKFFSGGNPIASGLWSDIKDRVVVQKGSFALNCYVAFKDGESLRLGALALTGCSLGPWFEFEKMNRKHLYDKAVVVRAGERTTTGSIKFTPPSFELADLSEASNTQATQLDKGILQPYFDGYFSRTTTERAVSRDHDADDEQPPPDEPRPDDIIDDDDIPF